MVNRELSVGVLLNLSKEDESGENQEGLLSASKLRMTLIKPSWFVALF